MNEALWALGRGTGVVALVMFTITLVLGIATHSGRSLGGLGRFGVADVHRTAALTGVGLIAVHVGSLLFDPFAQLRLVDVLFPFLGAYRPFWPVAWLHSLGTGTDAGSVWMTGVAATCFAAVTAAVGWRLLPSYGERGRTRTPRKGL